jgi:putative DNA primase/helicase
VNQVAQWQAESIARSLHGVRSGNGWLCRCPVIGHGQGRGDVHPSLSVADGDKRLLVHCHAGCDARDVLAALKQRNLLHESPTPAPTVRRLGPSRQEPDQKALAIWRSAKAAGGTVVETYLKWRGIFIPPPPSIRFGIAADFGDVPTMIAAIQRPDGAVIAIQRTFLTDDGQKANMRRPRRNMGEFHDGAVRLAEPSTTLGLAEGVEDALAATQLVGIPCWASLGAGRMATVAIPTSVRTIHIFADDDKAGRGAVEATVEHHTARGRTVYVRYPPLGHKDWGSIVSVNNITRNAA